MRKRSICLSTILFFLIFKTNIVHSQTKDTVVIGKALNARLGAVVVTSNENMYVIDSMEQWPSNLYDKKVKVTGKIERVVLGPKPSSSLGSTPQPEYDTINGDDYFVIRKPKIELYKKNKKISP